MAIDRQILAQFCRYLGVGGSTALVYLGLILVTVQLLHLGHMLAVSISYFCAIAFHFLANKIFTFQSRHGKVIWEILRYIPAALLNYGITLVVVFWLSTGDTDRPISAPCWPSQLPKASATA